MICTNKNFAVIYEAQADSCTKDKMFSIKRLRQNEINVLYTKMLGGYCLLLTHAPVEFYLCGKAR